MIPANTLPPAGTPATAPAPRLPGQAPAEAPAAGGGFTALLATALGQPSMSPVVAQLLGELEQAVDASAADGSGPEASAAALAEAVAALVGGLPGEPALAPPGMGPTTATADAAPVTGPAAQGQTDALASPLPTSQAIIEAAESVATDARMSTSLPHDGAATGTTPVAPVAPTTGATTAATPMPATPAAPAAAAAVAAAHARTPDPDGAATGPDTTAAPDLATPATTAPAAPTGAATSAPTAETATAPGGSLHARVVARVIEAAEALEHAPPPRSMWVDIPDGDGLRLQVSLRGSEVHVTVQPGAAQPDLGSWGRELAAGLASRGMTLGGFQAGTGSDAEQHQQQRPDQDLGSDGRAPRPSTQRRSRQDGDLRL